MIDAGWFVDVAVKSAAIAALALLAARVLRSRSAAERSSVLHGGLIAIALLPLLVVYGPRWQVDLPVMPDAATAAETSAPRDEVVARSATIPVAAASMSRPARIEHAADAAIGAPVPIDAGIDLAIAGTVIYALPALALLLALGASLSSLSALRDGAMPVRDPRWRHALRAAQRRSGVRGDVELLHSPDVASPLSWGIRRRIIVLDADAIDPAAAGSLLAHELAHLARHDWIKLLCARVVTAVFWFNPLAWRLAQRCHQVREEAADDAVLRGDVAGVDYAELLLRFARGRAQPAFAAHAIFSGRGAMQHLSQRIARALDDGERRTPAMRGWAFGCAVAALAIALPLAALAPAFTPAYAAEPAKGVIGTTQTEAPVATAAATDAPLTFTIGPRGQTQPGVVQVSFEQLTPHGHSTHSNGVPLASLQGLSAATLAAEQPQVAEFRLVRAAGTLHCEGSARRGLATGTCRFLPDAAFAAELERRGVGRITAREQLQLALLGASLDVLDELQRQGYDTPTAKRYIELSIHGVDVEWLRGLQSVGLKLDRLERLVEFRIHGIDAAYIAGLAKAGYDALPPKQLLEFRIHDVTAETIAGLADAGFAGMPAKQLVAMQIHGVTPEFAREMKTLGYGDVGAEGLVQFSIHAVTAEYVRDLAALGYRDLPASRLVEFRIHDVKPAFVRELNTLGYRDIDPNDLVAMRIHAVTPSYIRTQLADARGTPPSIDELVMRRIHGD